MAGYNVLCGASMSMPMTVPPPFLGVEVDDDGAFFLTMTMIQSVLIATKTTTTTTVTTKMSEQK